MNKLDELMKTLDDVKKGIVDDVELDEEEEQIKKRNKELMDRLNAINDSVKVDEKLIQSAPSVDNKIKTELQQSSIADFKSVFAKMGELFFASGSGFTDDITTNNQEQTNDKSEENQNKEDKDNQDHKNEEEEAKREEIN